MKVTPAAVRRQLEQLGYTDVPDEIVLEFLEELKSEAARTAEKVLSWKASSTVIYSCSFLLIDVHVNVEFLKGLGLGCIYVIAGATSHRARIHRRRRGRGIRRRDSPRYLSTTQT